MHFLFSTALQKNWGGPPERSCKRTDNRDRNEFPNNPCNPHPCNPQMLPGMILMQNFGLNLIKNKSIISIHCQSKNKPQLGLSACWSEKDCG